VLYASIIVARHNLSPLFYRNTAEPDSVFIVEQSGVREFSFGSLKGHSLLTSFLVHSYIFQTSCGMLAMPK
jgi:hypothetical protein